MIDDWIILYAGDENTGVFDNGCGRKLAEAPKEVVKEAELMLLPRFRYACTHLNDNGIENVFVPSIQHIIQAVKTCRERLKGK